MVKFGKLLFSIIFIRGNEILQKFSNYALIFIFKLISDIMTLDPLSGTCHQCSCLILAIGCFI